MDDLRAVLSRKLDYRRTFSTPEGERVLKDLHRFCHETTTSDPNEALYVMGMQRVYRRIASMMKLPPEDEIAFDTETETENE